MANDFDVLIVGAGPTGMTAGVALHDAGFSVGIIDKHASGLSFSRAILVNSATLRLLSPFGLASQIMKAGIPIQRMAIRGPEGSILEGVLDIRSEDGIAPTLLPQLDTEACLNQALAQRGIMIQRPAEFRGFVASDGGVQSEVDFNGTVRTIRSAYLLGADGRQSQVRLGLGFDYHQSPTPLRMYSQDAIIDWNSEPDVIIWILKQGAAIAMRLGEGKVRFAATSLQTFQSLGFQHRIQKTTWESEFDVYFAQVDRYGQDRVWLAGDAAHVHSPVGGRGMNMGIADAIAFASALKAGELASYEQQRHDVSSAWVSKNQKATRLISDQGFKGNLTRSALRTVFRSLNFLNGDRAAKQIFRKIAVG